LTLLGEKNGINSYEGIIFLEMNPEKNEAGSRLPDAKML
jgi:hypothetical protein